MYNNRRLAAHQQRHNPGKPLMFPAEVRYSEETPNYLKLPILRSNQLELDVELDTLDVGD